MSLKRKMIPRKCRVDFFSENDDFVWWWLSYFFFSFVFLVDFWLFHLCCLVFVIFFWIHSAASVTAKYQQVILGGFHVELDPDYRLISGCENAQCTSSACRFHCLKKKSGLFDWWMLLARWSSLAVNFSAHFVIGFSALFPLDLFHKFEWLLCVCACACVCVCVCVCVCCSGVWFQLSMFLVWRGEFSSTFFQFGIDSIQSMWCDRRE